jgi:hypothetical protein
MNHKSRSESCETPADLDSLDAESGQVTNGGLIG